MYFVVYGESPISSLLYSEYLQNHLYGFAISSPYQFLVCKIMPVEINLELIIPYSFDSKR